MQITELQKGKINKYIPLHWWRVLLTIGYLNHLYLSSVVIEVFQNHRKMSTALQVFPESGN